MFRFIALMFFAQFAIVSPTFAEDLSSLLTKVRNATVFLTVYFVDENNRQNRCLSPPNYGTGFVVSPKGGLITAQHIFNNENCPGFNDILVEARIGYKDTEQPGPAWPVKISKDDDIVAARLGERREDYDFLEVCFVELPEIGTPLLALGFPVEEDFTYIKTDFQGLANDGRWRVSSDATFGMSGGPVIDYEGRVIGITKSGVPNTPAVRFVTPLLWAGDELATVGVRDVQDCGKPAVASLREDLPHEEKLQIVALINASGRRTETVHKTVERDFSNDQSCTEPWQIVTDHVCLPNGTPISNILGPTVISAAHDGQTWYNRDPNRADCVNLVYGYSDRGLDVVGNCRGNGWITASWTLEGVRDGEVAILPYQTNTTLDPPAQGPATATIVPPAQFTAQLAPDTPIRWEYAVTVRNEVGELLAELTSDRPRVGRFRSEQESNGAVIISIGQ